MTDDRTENSEVIRDALRDWKLKRAVQQQQIEELRQLWDQGINSGSAGSLDMNAIKREARRRIGAEKDPPSSSRPQIP
jgi:antitoxin ParD1/3/4